MTITGPSPENLTFRTKEEYRLKRKKPPQIVVFLFNLCTGRGISLVTTDDEELAVTEDLTGYW